MTIEIKHAFTSLKGDGGDATLVRPSNWNAVHSTSMATGQLVGRLTAGAGTFEEIPISALVAAALDETTGAAFLAAIGAGGFSAGDMKPTIKTTADAGWIMLDDGTIGPTGSAATTRANNDCLNVYTLLWAISNTYAPVTGGRGASAAADWAAAKPIKVLSILGRVIGSAGTGSGLAAKALGLFNGVDSYTFGQNQLPNATLALNGTAPGTVALNDTGQRLIQYNGLSDIPLGNTAPSNVSGLLSPASLTVTLPAPQGSSRLNGNVTQVATSNQQAGAYVNWMMKL